MALVDQKGTDLPRITDTRQAVDRLVWYLFTGSVAILLALGGFTYTALSARVDEQVQTNANLRERVARVEADGRSLDARLSSIDGRLTEMNQKLDRLVERRP